MVRPGTLIAIFCAGTMVVCQGSKRRDTEVDKAKRSEVVIVGRVTRATVDEINMTLKLKNALATQREIIIAVFALAGKRPASQLIVGKKYYMLRFHIRVEEVLRGTCRSGDVLTVDHALVTDRRSVMDNGKVKTTNTAKFVHGKRSELVCLMMPRKGLNYRPVMAGVADSLSNDGIRRQVEEVRKAFAALRSAPRITPYHEFLRQSEIVVIGAVESCAPVEVKDKPKASTDGKPSFLSSAEFLRSRLGAPKRLFTCRARIRVGFVARGQVNKEIALETNLAYASNRKAIEAFIKSAPVKKMIVPDARLILHLKTAPDSTAKAPLYELVTLPWTLKKSELKAKSRDMMIRMTRYAAFLQIDMMLHNFEELKKDDLALLKRLAAGKGTNMSIVRNLPVEQKLFDAALGSKGRSKKAAKTWRIWWGANRSIFVDKPFRIVAGNAPDKTPKKSKKGK